MNKEQLDELRSRLVTERDRLNGEISDLRNVAVKATTYLEDENDVYDNHPADDAASLVGRLTDMTLLENLEHELADNEAALRRMDAGSYGICEMCGQPIAERRLEARPAARTCITCQAKLEEQQRREAAVQSAAVD